MTRRQAPEDFLWSTSTPSGAPRLPEFAGGAVAWGGRLEQGAKFFNDFSRARACARAQGGVHSEWLTANFLRSPRRMANFMARYRGGDAHYADVECAYAELERYLVLSCNE